MLLFAIFHYLSLFLYSFAQARKQKKLLSFCLSDSLQFPSHPNKMVLSSCDWIVITIALLLLSRHGEGHMELSIFWRHVSNCHWRDLRYNLFPSILNHKCP